MDQGEVVAEATPPDEAAAGHPPRMVVKSLSFGIVSGLIGLGLSGPLLAAGSMGGALAAGLYSSAYLRSHLSRLSGRTKIFDPAIARSAALRFVVLAAAGLGALLAGRLSFVGFLIAFAVCFIILVASEVPRISAELRRVRNAG